MKYLKEAVDFIKQISKKDEIVIIFNNDGDGICSCALFMKYLESAGLKKPYIISQPMPMDKNLMQRIKTTIPNKIIFLDLVVDQQEDVVKRVRGLADVLIVDHHQIMKNLNSKKPMVVHFNPRFTDKDVYTSTTYNAHKILSEIIDMSEHLWVTSIGMISDYNLDDSKDLVEAAKKKYKASNLHSTEFSRMSNMIFSSIASKELSCEQIAILFADNDLEALKKSEGFDKMSNALQTINNEIEMIMSDAESSSRRNGNMVAYNIRSKFNLNSVISTKLSEKHLDKLVLVYSKSGSRYKVSARNQKKNINAGRVMSQATKDLNASGGGHEAAAGATVDEKDWEKFLKKVEELANL